MDLYDLRQNRRINQTEDETRRNFRSLQENQEVTADLQKSVKQLSLVCKAMWQLLQETSGIPEQALLEKIQELQQETNTALKCSQCGRPQLNQNPTCLYCGTAFPNDATDSYFGI